MPTAIFNAVARVTVDIRAYGARAANPMVCELQKSPDHRSDDVGRVQQLRVVVSVNHSQRARPSIVMRRLP